jgi:hypothetical protein
MIPLIALYSNISAGSGAHRCPSWGYDSLVKTVRSLEGDLADHNLATDKQRALPGKQLRQKSACRDMDSICIYDWSYGGHLYL